jgi:hypothetical protein
MVALVATAVALLGAGPAAAAPEWTQPIAVTPVDYYAQLSQDVAGNARDDAIVAWTTVHDQAVGYARRSAGGAFGPATTIQGTGDSAQTAMNASGDAVVVWREGSSAHGVILPAGSSAQIPFALSARDRACTASPAAGIDDAGAVTVVWDDCDHLWAARRPPGGSFGPAQAIAIKGSGVSGLQLAVAGNGTAVAVWTDYDGIYAAVSTTGSSFSTTVLTSDKYPDALLYDTQLGVPSKVFAAADASGDIAVSTLQEDHRTNLTDEIATTKPAGKPFKVPQVIQGISPQSWDDHVAVSSNGDATAVWVGFSRDQQQRGLWASTSHDGTWGAPELIQDGTVACYPDVAASAGGEVHVVWNGYDNGCEGSNGYEFTSARAAGAATFGPVGLLSEGGDAVFPPAIAPQGAHGAVAAWPQGRLAPDYQQQIMVATTSAGGGGGSTAPGEPAQPGSDPGAGPESAPGQDSGSSGPATRKSHGLRAGHPRRGRAGRVRLRLRCESDTRCRARIVLLSHGRRVATHGPITVAAGKARVVTLHLRRRAARSVPLEVRLIP